MPTSQRHRLTLRRVVALVSSGFCVALVGCGIVEPQPQETTPQPIPKSGIGLPGNWLSTPQLFTAGAEIVALAATPSRLIASTRGASHTKLVSVTETGEMQPFAPGFVAPADALCPLEVAPGIGTFPQGTVYVALGPEVWLLASDGSATAVFATLPDSDLEIVGLAFDPVGGFGYDLVALTRSGAVYRIDDAGRTRLVGDVGAGGSGPSVATARLGRFAGQLLVAFPQSSEVRAIDSGGNVNLVLLWSGVSGAHMLPDSPRSFGSTGGGFFVATAAGELYQFRITDLEARGGQLLLTSIHRSGSGILIPEPSGFRTVPFSRSMGPEIAAAPVRRPAVTPITIEVLPGQNPKVIVLGSMDYVPVGVFASTGFTPSILVGGEVLLAGALPVSKSTTLGIYTDLNGDGQLDLLLRFRAADMQLPLGEANLTLEGTCLTGERVRGSGHVLILEP